MALACQRDSYLQKFTTEVVSCDPAQITLTTNGKKNKVNCFQVFLKDTILFPEGGGQPDDRGTINGTEVIKVERKGASAVHYTLSEIPPGSEVIIKVDWQRRFDHMQQHTAQHLITGIADSLFGFKTTSWYLADTVVSIELDTPSISKEQLDAVEQAVNEKIRAAVSVKPHLYPDKTDPQLSQFRARGLPDDHEGPVRVLEIQGIDTTLCCGTHVSSLSHLQAIKILGSEKGKKEKSQLFFVAGDRLLKYLGRSYQVEKELTGILKGPLDKHCELAEKAVKGHKANEKVAQSFLKEVAQLEAEVYKLQPQKDPIFCHFRKDGDGDYMSALVSKILAINKDAICLVCIGDEKGSGLVTLAGPPQIVTDLGPRIADVLEAKGAVTGGRYRGKAAKIGNWGKAEKLIREHASGLLQPSGDCKPESRGEDIQDS